ncbi:hypothetical protein BGW80DRAFT_1386103 [Lactifluus volemus]|nr:hypothetical protein BGW80DRAFT_1386103 [Lactifluus volemus]
MPYRLKCLELKNLSRAPSPLKSINFRHTTPGSGLALVTNHKPQSTSELFDPTYPGAHLPLGKRRSLAPRWIHPTLSLFALPKAYLTKPDVPYPEPYKSRPYPESLRRPEQRSVDMSMQFVSFKSHVVLKPVVRTKIKRRLREVVKLIVTRGAAVEESRTGQKVVVLREEDVGADKWIVPDWTYIARPTTELFRMPFAELLDLMRKTLESLHRRIPKVESILRRHRRSDATSLVRSTADSDII